ncbi:MAG TPA: hypothetical protein VLK84_27525 [Longimicrobium sp.]|nr:hypothetical protein [Longimicrobium sp.]
MRRRPIALLLFAILPGASCQRTTGEMGPLAGEWAVSLDADRGRDGVIIFHPAIPCYCVEPGELPAGAEVGRAYLDPAAMGQSPRTTTSRHFAVGDDADYYEEVIGEVEGSAVVITTRGPAGPRFEGIMEGDSIRGRWIYTLHGDTLRSGRMSMNRGHASEYTDSARVRSRRGVEGWMSAPAVRALRP